ncbi:L,D-transpeptidase family protein [Hyphomicrobium sp. LHD-15]|uniref:L,D-transpeptidase family protein n=1 Tax=Hyphomicrobium sp. LHD-15 TaxID=3072142 RepID=UPI00280E1CDF|nr:L,D-transpeptidase family protein [Hyphomicrobium sp. LHD-15]MDQ8697969.1 L,D-transpeptidase family protein [Hyphomicrobium sp. LHD-15]
MLAVALFTDLAVVSAQAQAPSRSTYEKNSYRSSEKSRQKPRPVEQAKPLQADGPLLMLVSLNQQRMYVYDSNGFVVQTRVSSGRTGHETPVGIYSIIEKKVDHTSNIYLDAKMPHMQRLTMTGIALHGGVIPGYPASGGCVRLPFEFARRFFGMTDISQRVVIAPDVQSPIEFTHPLLFSALPSVAEDMLPGKRAETTGDKAIKIGVDVAESLLGVSSAHAATEPQGRTLEGAAEARRAERQRLVDAIGAASDRRTAASESDKAAIKGLADARNAAKAARGEAGKLSRAAEKAAYAQKSQERALKSIQTRIEKSSSKMRADKLAELQAQEAATKEKIAPLTADAASAADAAKAAGEAAKAAEAALDEAQAKVKAAKAEIKDAASAEAAAKTAVAKFDRVESNRELPVSMFISSKTGMIHIRQGFEKVLDLQAEIVNPDVPLDTFVFTAVAWKDDTKTDLKWTATEVSEHSSGILGYGNGSERKKGAPEEVKLPSQTDAQRAAQTLDRIKIPKEASDWISEVMKPGSTLIVSSYDMARSETRYAGTDFVVQMPEVVAKISKPTPRPKTELVEDEGGGGCFFFCSSYSSNSPAKKRRVGGGKSNVW